MQKPKTIDVDKLSKAIGFLRQGHVKGVYARDKNDVVCFYSDPQAYAFCLTGALYKTGAKLNDISDLFEGLLPGPYGLAYWNDMPERTLEQVIELIEKAIEKFEKLYI